MNNTFKLFFAMILMIISTATSNEVIIGNTSEKELSEDQVKMIYLGKVSRWKDGKKIILVTLKKGTTHESFMTNCLNKRSRNFTLYWKQRMFTGRGVMPRTFNTEEEMINFVKNTEGAIGYISDTMTDSLPKAISILRICEHK